jgi:hypothetical protein
VNYLNKIVRVKADKSVTVVAEGPPLQSPASLAIDTDNGGLLVTSAALEALMDPTKAKPALVRVPLQ